MEKKSKKHKSEKTNKKIREKHDKPSEHIYGKRIKLETPVEPIVIEDSSASNHDNIPKSSHHRPKLKKKKKHRTKIIEIDSDENEIENYKTVACEKSKRKKKKHEKKKTKAETLATVTNVLSSDSKYSTNISSAMVSTETSITHNVEKTPKKNKKKHKHKDKQVENHTTNSKNFTYKSTISIANNIKPERHLEDPNYPNSVGESLTAPEHEAHNSTQISKSDDINNGASTSKHKFNEDTYPEIEESTFAERFSSLLSQSSTKTDNKNEEESKVNSNVFERKSSHIDEWFQIAPKKSNVRVTAFFKRLEMGKKVEVDLRKAEKYAQNEILIRNIVSYNRDVNNLSATTVKLNTPVFRYCSKNQSGDIFISDVEISSEDEVLKTDPDIKFIKPSKFKFNIRVLNDEQNTIL